MARNEGSRRRFLENAFSAGSGLWLAGPFEALARGGAADRPQAGYGPLQPRPDESTRRSLLALPDGFRYWSLGAVGSLMSDGRPTPPFHDGMAAFSAPGGRVHLVRNHEVRSPGLAFGPSELAYDPQAGGGTTNLLFDPASPDRPESFASLSGTSTNCAGGPTPWGSWLTCEETFHEASVEGRKLRHGYVFEVPSAARSAVAATPLRALGRFVHEAVAVDPATGILYETEDADRAGFFRFVPDRAGDCTAGRLQMMAVADRPRYDARSRQRAGRVLPVSWVDVEVADPDEGRPTCHEQGFARGGARFRRLEGATWSPHDRAVYVSSTDGGDSKAGQIWAYRPAPEGGSLTLVYESPSPDRLFKPDNLTVSPSGGLVICEDPDGSRPAFVRGLTREGVPYSFAGNAATGTMPASASPAVRDEFAGACFSPDGQWLFLNLQGHGLTFAITGPWEKGPLGARA